MERADTRCVLCNSERRALLHRQGDWYVYGCPDCGLGILDPRPDQNERGVLYQNSYFQEQYDQGLEPGSSEMKRRLSHEHHRVRFFRGKKKRGRLLDIGSGMGYFLLACRNYGYHVEGFDISDAAAAYVQGRLEIPVKTGDIASLPYESQSWDIITMWHFLEHTPEPRVYLKKAWQWLKPDGLLVVEVPNYAGTDARKTWEQWKGWQLPYHLYHFTEQTLCDMLSQYGFRPIRKKNYLSEYVKECLEKYLLMRPFARLIARCYSGHSVAVVSRKVPLMGHNP